MLQVLKLFLVILLVFPGLGLASELVLKSGEKLEGKIVEQKDRYVKFDTGVGVVMTYYTDEINTIDGQSLQIREPIKIIETTVQEKKPLSSDNDYVITNEEKSEYSAAFSFLLNMLKNGDLNNPSSFAALNQFKAKYSKSPLGGDAQYVFLLMEFCGSAIAKKESEAKQEIDNMQKFIQVHPNGTVNQLTKQIWSDILGEKSSWVLNIPNNLVLDYMLGFAAVHSQDYETCIKHYSILKNHLNFYNENKEEIKGLVNEVYAGLSVSYLLLHKNDDLKVLAKEAKEKFPEDAGLNNQFQKMLN